MKKFLILGSLFYALLQLNACGTIVGNGARLVRSDENKNKKSDHPAASKDNLKPSEEQHDDAQASLQIYADLLFNNCGSPLNNIQGLPFTLELSKASTTSLLNQEISFSEATQGFVAENSDFNLKYYYDYSPANAITIGSEGIVPPTYTCLSSVVVDGQKYTVSFADESQRYALVWYRSPNSDNKLLKVEILGLDDESFFAEFNRVE